MVDEDNECANTTATEWPTTQESFLSKFSKFDFPWAEYKQ